MDGKNKSTFIGEVNVKSEPRGGGLDRFKRIFISRAEVPGLDVQLTGFADLIF
jgi:hypothetical protein